MLPGLSYPLLSRSIAYLCLTFSDPWVIPSMGFSWQRCLHDLSFLFSSGLGQTGLSDWPRDTQPLNPDSRLSALSMELSSLCYHYLDLKLFLIFSGPVTAGLSAVAHGQGTYVSWLAIFCAISSFTLSWDAGQVYYHALLGKVGPPFPRPGDDLSNSLQSSSGAFLYSFGKNWHSYPWASGSFDSKLAFSQAGAQFLGPDTNFPFGGSLDLTPKLDSVAVLFPCF